MSDGTPNMLRKKVLCLHGFTQNGPLFAKKSSAVSKALSKIGYETVFVTAPFPVEISDVSFEIQQQSLNDGNMRTWWNTNKARPKYYNLDSAFDTIRQSIETDGPFTGVMGFSQGAALAGIMCQHIHNLHESQPQLKFGIFYCGFKVMIPEHRHFYAQPISIPTLHVLGSLDTIVPEKRSMALYEASEVTKRVLLVHPGGHFVPSSRDILNQVTHFVEKAEQGASVQGLITNESSAAAVDEWAMFDKIGKI